MTVNAGIDELQPERIAELVQSYGSPLYILSERTLVERYRVFAETLRSAYERSRVAYSFKTNYLRAVCNILKREGALAEVVSGFEYGLARDAGYLGDEIIFNGPYKADKDLQRALQDGARVHVDSMEELEHVYAHAEETKTAVSIAIRISSHEIANHIRGGKPGGLFERFGFLIENGDAEAACAFAAKSDGLVRINGYHMHIASGIVRPDLHARSTEILIGLAHGMRHAYGVTPSYIDMGGGFPDAAMERDGESVLTHILRGIGDAMARSSLDPLPELILEPGRALVASAMTHVASVVSVKNRGADQLVTMDTAMSILPTGPGGRHDIRAVAGGAHDRPSILAGSSCMGRDVFGRYRLPLLQARDLLSIEGCGAYSVSMSSQFITPRPAIVCIAADGSVALVRRAETAEDIMRLDQ